MFVLKKILGQFLLPPGIFIAILLCSGLWFLFKRTWKAGFINCFLGISMWVFSIAPVSDFIMRGLESDFKIPENPHGDVIIILGGGVYETVPDMSGIGSPSEGMLGRIITAVRLQKRLDVPVIISGGAVFKGKKAEAPIVRRILIDLGIPDTKIIIEDKSRDTIENARYSSEICKKIGCKRPILVTSASHMRRSVIAFKKVDLEVVPFPANFRAEKAMTYGWEDYLPRIGFFEKVSTAFHEYIGLLFYKIAY